MAGMRSRGRALPIAASCVILLSLPAAGQDGAPSNFKVEALTADELSRGRAFGVEFVRQLAMRRDAAPLVPDWFVRDFPAALADVLTATERSSIDHRSMLLFLLAPDFARSLEPDTLVDYYIAHLNFWYLANLRNVSRLSPAELRGVNTFDGALPVSVSQRLYENEQFKALLALPLGEVMTGDAGGRKLEIDSMEALQRGLDSLRAAAELLRGNVARPPAEASATYREISRAFDAAAAMAAPGSMLGRATVCLAECAGYPAGTRVLEVSVLPSLHLHLIDRNRALRVLFVDLPVM